MVTLSLIQNMAQKNQPDTKRSRGHKRICIYLNTVFTNVLYLCIVRIIVNIHEFFCVLWLWTSQYHRVNMTNRSTRYFELCFCPCDLCHWVKTHWKKHNCGALVNDSELLRLRKSFHFFHCQNMAPFVSK